jgi:hypothetical protein
MDWTTYLASVISTTALIGVVTFIGKKWLGTRIEESVKHEYAKKLEEYKIQQQEAEERRATDRILFEKFLNELPSSGIITSLRTQEGVWSYRDEEFDQLFGFYDKWNRPEFSFLDTAIEEKRKLLYESVNELLTYKSLNTFSLGQGYHGVPGEWVDTQPERFDITISKLNDLSKKVISAHEDFIQTARKLLRC